MKLIKITFILLFLIISVACVSAQDTNSTDIISDEAPLETTEEFGSFTELQNEINNATNTLDLTKNYKNEIDGERVDISKDNLVINGNNHIIDGNKGKIFLISGTNVTINNLILANAYTDSAGGSALYNLEKATLNNVTFINNSAAAGGAIFNGGVMELNNVVFINNSAINGGGALYNYMGFMDVHGAVFINNSAAAGGAVFNGGSVMELHGAVFINNSALDIGGAVDNIDSVVGLYDAVFINNSALDGAAVLNSNSVTDLKNVSFVNNIASLNSVIFNNANMTFSNVSFVNNSAQLGGAVFSSEGFVEFHGVTFINNTAVNGGAVNGMSCVFELCDVTFINNSAQYGGGALYCEDVVADICDAVFINNSASEFGGAILSNYNTTITCRNSNFTDNSAKFGNEFHSYQAKVLIYGCLFESTFHRYHGAIWALYSDMEVNDSVFANFTTDYAPAVFIHLGNLTINNTRFINLHANVSAGAVAAKGSFAIIENSAFMNTSAAKNGGAILIDAIDTINNIYAIADIRNVSFINTSGDFGGAYLQLGGDLNMFASTFINCTSKYDGGAIYLSYVNSEIGNSTFISNRNTLYDDYPTFGGAIYFDNKFLLLHDSTFINNSAALGSGVICMYESSYHIENSTFDNGGEAIHSILEVEGCEIIDFHGNDTISNDNVFLPSLIAGSHMNLTWVRNEINVETIPIRFDLRDFNWVSPVKSQGIKGACAAYGAIASLESALLKSSDLSIDLSENNMFNTMLFYSKYGFNYAESGNLLLEAAYLLSWFGAITEEQDSYDEMGKISPLIIASDNIHIQDLGMIWRNPELNETSGIKEAILKYGAVYADIKAAAVQGDSYEFYDSLNFSQYTPFPSQPNHAICIVGWDDTFSKDKFLVCPPGDGAWICKNSWGTGWGDEGYFYVSYYDQTIASSFEFGDGAMYFLFENNVSYNKNYQYDFTGLCEFLELGDGDEESVSYANRFTASDDDLIAAVGTYFNQSGVNYTIDIEVNGNKVLSQNGISPYRGYHTIKLDNYVSIKKGDEFVVYINSNVLPISYNPRIAYNDNVSMTDYWGNWTDLVAKNESVACLKVYTVEDDSRIISNRNIAVDYDGGKYFSVKVLTGDGHAVAGAKVTFTLNGKTTTVKTDKNGIAKIKISQTPGKYTIKTVFNGRTYTNKITVRQVLTASKVTVKKTARKVTLKARLKINGKLVKGKWITFKFNGKTYKAKTNSKGIAQKTFNKNVIKKLKKGKTYTVKVTYIKDTIKTSLKVK